jgi:hypothetical protein
MPYGVFWPSNGVLSTDFSVKSENCGLLSKDGKLKSKEFGMDSKESKADFEESETKSLEFAPAGLVNREF